jgi:hypothetical protein
MKRSAWLFAGIFLWCAIGVVAQEAVVTLPESLVVEGVPKIPVSLAEKAGRMVAITSCSRRISAAGNGISFSDWIWRQETSRS